MAFGRESTVTATGIGGIVIELSDLILTDGSGDHKYLGTYAVKVQRSDGSEVVRSGNLLPHLTTAQRNGLLSFMADLRAQAEAQILPEA
jgi:hypothetical protein